MAAMGGNACTRASVTQAPPGSRSTDLRREVSQLLQQMAVDSFLSSASANLEQKLDALDFCACPMDSKANVRTEALDVAEETIRKVVHQQVLDSYKRVSKMMKVDGCGVVKERGSLSQEDAFGFLTATGGFSEHKVNMQIVPSGAIELDSADELIT